MCARSAREKSFTFDRDDGDIVVFSDSFWYLICVEGFQIGYAKLRMGSLSIREHTEVEVLLQVRSDGNRVLLWDFGNIVYRVV